MCGVRFSVDRCGPDIKYHSYRATGVVLRCVWSGELASNGFCRRLACVCTDHSQHPPLRDGQQATVVIVRLHGSEAIAEVRRYGQRLNCLEV